MNPTSETPPEPIPHSAAQPPVGPSPETPLPDKPDFRTLVEALLRRPVSLVMHLAHGSHGATVRFGALALVSFLLFGLVLGCFAKNEQLWAAPLKIAAGLLISGAICFPSLYIFTTLAGSRVSLGQLAATFAGALSLAGLLLLGFAPAVWIFAESTDSFGFMGVLAVGAWLVSFTFALRFLRAMALVSGGTQAGPLRIWSFVFLLVTLQMTTSLRPILGRSDEFLTSEKKFFLQHWSHYFGENLPE